MQRLADTPELMDGPLDTEVLSGNLRDLVRVNRYLGGTHLSLQALGRLIIAAGGGATIRLLDIGTGAADIPAALISRLAGRGTTLTVHAMDERAEMIEAARSRIGIRPDLILEVTQGGSTLPYPDDAFDVAHCSLVLHHLEPPEATSLLREAGRVSRIGVIVNDLDRTIQTWAGAWLLSHLATRNRYTRHDAPLSVRRAHRAAEVEQMAADVGLVSIARFRGFLGHRYTVVLVHPSAGTAKGLGPSHG